MIPQRKEAIEIGAFLFLTILADLPIRVQMILPDSIQIDGPFLFLALIGAMVMFIHIGATVLIVLAAALFTFGARSIGYGWYFPGLWGVLGDAMFLVGGISLLIACLLLADGTSLGDRLESWDKLPRAKLIAFLALLAVVLNLIQIVQGLLINFLGIFLVNVLAIAAGVYVVKRLAPRLFTSA